MGTMAPVAPLAGDSGNGDAATLEEAAIQLLDADNIPGVLGVLDLLIADQRADGTAGGAVGGATGADITTSKEEWAQIRKALIQSRKAHEAEQKAQRKALKAQRKAQKGKSPEQSRTQWYVPPPVGPQQPAGAPISSPGSGQPPLPPPRSGDPVVRRKKPEAFLVRRGRRDDPGFDPATNLSEARYRFQGRLQVSICFSDSQRAATVFSGLMRGVAKGESQDLKSLSQLLKVVRAQGERFEIDKGPFDWAQSRLTMYTGEDDTVVGVLSRIGEIIDLSTPLSAFPRTVAGAADAGAPATTSATADADIGVDTDTDTSTDTDTDEDAAGAAGAAAPLPATPTGAREHPLFNRNNLTSAAYLEDSGTRRLWFASEEQVGSMTIWEDGRVSHEQYEPGTFHTIAFLLPAYKRDFLRAIRDDANEITNMQTLLAYAASVHYPLPGATIFVGDSIIELRERNGMVETSMENWLALNSLEVSQLGDKVNSLFQQSVPVEQDDN